MRDHPPLKPSEHDGSMVPRGSCLKAGVNIPAWVLEEGRVALTQRAGAHTARQMLANTAQICIGCPRDDSPFGIMGAQFVAHLKSLSTVLQEC